MPPALLLVVAFVLALRGGGVAAHEWQPLALGLAATLFMLSALGAVPRVPRSALPLLVSLAALVLWGVASFAWTESREGTFEHVIRLGMLAAAAVVGVAYATRIRAALVLAAGLALFGAAAVATIEIKLLTGDADAFIGTRLSWPINYANADAALVWLPLPALLTFAAAPALRPLLRGAFGLVAALALAVGLTAQSRGGAIALAGALLTCVAIARDRSRFSLTLLVVIASVAAIVPHLVGQEASPADLARERGQFALLAAVVAGGVVFVVAVLDRRDRFPFGGRETPVAVITWTLALALAAAAFLNVHGRPDKWASARWSEFTNLQSAVLAPARDASHFGTGASQRYDYWRVAWHTFEDAPITGVGAGAFAVPWFRSRVTDESVTDAHSWEAGALAETGLVGLVIAFAVFLHPIARIRSLRAGPGAWPTAAIALGGAGVYFVLHASVDWVFRIPAIAIPGFVVVGALAGGGSSNDRLTFANRGDRVALATGALALLFVATPAYLSTARVARAESESAISMSEALEELETAARLNPLASEPLIIRATLLQLDGRPKLAFAAATEATRRAPHNWAAWLVLAESARAAGRPKRAVVAFRRAQALNPRRVRSRT